MTGVTGQDGGYLAEMLAGAGIVVHGTVHQAPLGPHLLALGERLTAHQVDLCDAAATRRLVAEIAPDEIYHLAGATSVATSWLEPARALAVNSGGSASVLDAAWRLTEGGGGGVRVVQAVSAEIFAGAATSPQDESTPLAPTSPYGVSKAATHLLAAGYRRRGLAVSSLILYNHESPRRPPHFVTRKITMAAARIALGLQEELVLGNLDARRDWGWAPEYVEAMVAAARADQPDDFVIATGRSHSVAEVVEAAFAAAGLDWTRYVRSDPALLRPGDAAELVGNPARAADRLGWAAEVQLPELARRMVEHDIAELGSRAR